MLNKNRKKDTKKSKPSWKIRLEKDLVDIESDPYVNISFPKGQDNIEQIAFTVIPSDKSIWKGAKYDFVLEIPSEFPHKAPKATCGTTIWHPNIDLEGNVCLNILRADWAPVLTILNVIHGIMFLFDEPNPNDPLNQEAAEMFRDDRKQFEEFVKRTLRGGHIKGKQFQRFV
ncbi:Ubiquitin-conjugating enzyme/RWD-like protein [Pseudocohnilembus persalinus]|uniref:Ubiquitin-conjugating enzyme/RWD-like protein n=1 Tax=Pseudocohnilembus persalinus TaxID=266149 RepID=A0A0V0QCD0_PSEPJ|nr:Ubiquitin-conjugating enzyme/RWD-like protein [Pseudocohnilembus persalinus]|eukprot:KRW99891.1 Ubiquitin-conjugating enzyme/RWD-like protein [Pseudocohnilembus persalinus]